MIKMLYGSGLRLSELINLEIADIDSARMLIRIVKSKGNKDRVVTLPESILTDLRTCYILHKPDVYLLKGSGAAHIRQSPCRWLSRTPRQEPESGRESRLDAF